MPITKIVAAACFSLPMLAQNAAVPHPLKPVTEARDKAKAALDAKNIQAAQEHCRLGLDLFGRLPAKTRVANASFRIQFDMLAAEVDKADALVEAKTRQAADFLKADRPALAQRALAEIAEYVTDPRYQKIKVKLPPSPNPTKEPDPRLYAVHEYWTKAQAEYEAKNIQVAKETCRARLARFEKLPKELKKEHDALKARFELLQSDIERADRLLEERTKAVRALIDGRALARAQAALQGIEEYRQDPRYAAVKRLLDEQLAESLSRQPVQPSAQQPTQQVQAPPPVASSSAGPNPSWIYGRWRRADGEHLDSPGSMEITSYRWIVHAGGKPCEMAIRSVVFSADMGTVSLTAARENGTQVRATLHPDATGASLILFLQTERMPACINRDAKYVRAAAVLGATSHSVVTSPSPQPAAQPDCKLAGTTWRSADKDKLWTLFFADLDAAGNFDGQLSPQDPRLGNTVKLRVQCVGPRKAYLTTLEEGGLAAAAELIGEKELKLGGPLPSRDKGVKRFIR